MYVGFDQMESVLCYALEMNVGICRLLVLWFFFFFKQKTAYEMRISDWSSDVCSSDLIENWYAVCSVSGCRSALTSWMTASGPKVVGTNSILAVVTVHTISAMSQHN